MGDSLGEKKREYDKYKISFVAYIWTPWLLKNGRTVTRNLSCVKATG